MLLYKKEYMRIQPIKIAISVPMIKTWWLNLSKEKRIQIAIICKLCVIMLCATLYGFGGIESKWLRRFLMPSIAVGCMYLYSRDWRCFIQLPFWMGALSMGYGADSTWLKILRRGIVGLSAGLASSGKFIIDRNWFLLCFQIILLISAYIIFGVWNPFPSARAEETILGMFQVAIPILGTKRKEN